MKIRMGFVSNSSSSSFVIIADSGLRHHLSLHGQILMVDGSLGVTEFGWDNTVYKGVYDKINFAYIQARYAKRQDWVNMLTKVLLEETGAYEVEYHLSTECNWGEDHEQKSKYAYIDHQSNATEGQNTEMFDNEESLRNFIFRTGSYIQGGNDNE